MPRTQTVAVQSRNAIIYAEVQAGRSLRQVGQDHGLSHTAIANIVAQFQGKQDDETKRGVHSALLESMITELLTDFHEAEPDPKISATGQIIKIDDEVIFDKMTWLNTKATVAKVIQGLMESERKMLATNIPAKLPMPVSEARSEMDEYLADIEAKAKAAKHFEVAKAEAKRLGIMMDGDVEELQTTYRSLRTYLSLRINIPWGTWAINSSLGCFSEFRVCFLFLFRFVNDVFHPADKNTSPTHGGDKLIPFTSQRFHIPIHGRMVEQLINPVKLVCGRWSFPASHLFS